MLLSLVALVVALADTIPAGSSRVNGASLPLGTTRKQLVLEDSTGSHVLGTLTQVLSKTTIDGRTGLLSVQTFDFGGKVTVDTSFADLRTLTPILHRSHNDARVMTLDFDAAHVRGSFAPKTGDAKPIDHATSRSTFDSNIADLVYAALPLADGYSATIPTYVYEESGLVWNDITVTADAPISNEPVWHVHAHSAKRDVDYWVTRKSRIVVKSRYQIGPGRVLRIEQ